MSSNNSLALKIYKEFPFFKKAYFFYNIYIRNFKYLFGGSQFNEENDLFDLFEKGHIGNYVDVGCFHPNKFSNTRKMHRSGWDGINIDLNPFTIDLFNFARPKATNLCVALSNKVKKTKIYHHHELSPQNTINKDHLKWMEEHFGLKKLKSKFIKTQTLENVLKKYNFINIDFLNVDIEGNELEVITSLNLKKFKVKLICIEILGFNNLQKKRKKKLLNYLKRNKYRMIKKMGSNYIFKSR